MSTPRHFQLIDGTFTPDQARQVLGAMVKSKIDFHSLLRHSEHERSARSGLGSEDRLPALRELDRSLREVFESAKADGKKVMITCGIEITTVD